MTYGHVAYALGRHQGVCNMPLLGGSGLSSCSSCYCLRSAGAPPFSVYDAPQCHLDDPLLVVHAPMACMSLLRTSVGPASPHPVPVPRSITLTLPGTRVTEGT